MPTVKERYAPHIDNIPYLTLPLQNDFQITEGYIYSNNERQIHGQYFHKGIDYKCPYSTPVYACADGYAVAGYHRFPVLNKDHTLRLYKGLPIGNGLGYFVQIYHPYGVCKIKGGRITQYGHLSKFAKGFKIQTFKPLKINYKKEIINWNNKRKKKLNTLEKDIKNTLNIRRRYPWTKKIYGYNFSKYPLKRELYTYTLKEIKEMYKKGNKYIRLVKQGDLIGYTGTSALIWGNLKYRENCRKPNIKPFTTWDEIHLHFEEATRDISGTKISQRDPYNIYLSKEHYKNIKQETLFINEKQRRLW